MINYERTDNFVGDIQNIIEKSQRQAYQEINTILTQRNWLIGYRIAQEEMHGGERAEYGANIAVSRQSHIRLSWSHYRVLLQVLDPKARAWYEKEAYEQT